MIVFTRMRAYVFPSLLWMALPRVCEGHAFGVRYDLPLPLSFFLLGGGAAVCITLALSTVLLKPKHLDRLSGHYDFSFSPRSFAWLRFALAVSGLAVFFGVIISAIFGVNSPTRNFAPTFVWVIWWVGFAYVTQIVINLWPWLNPWRWLSSLLGRRQKANESGAAVYARKLGYWPAVAFLFAFAWIELVSSGGEQPRTLAALILAYTALTCLGVWLTGARHWLAHGELFSVMFGMFGRFSLIAPRSDGVRLRIFGHGLLDNMPVAPALMVFVVLALSTVTFDGFMETPAWAAILNLLASDSTVRPVLLALRELGVDLTVAIKTVALVLAPLGFLALYLACCRMMSALTEASVDTLSMACTFVLSLVPIAIAYHFAHYYSFLLTAGQLIIALLSDPLGYGWNLFGTAHRPIDITVINAKTTWYVALVSIVLGHAIAVVVGHVTALRVFNNRHTALLTQIPLGVLMIGYTVASLWILSQPIVTSPAL